MEWTPEATEELGQHIDNGLTASEVVAKMGGGLTTNAVIGKAHREGWGFGKARPLPSMNTLMVLADQLDEFPDEALACITTPDELAAAVLDQHKITQKALEPMMARVLGDEGMKAQVERRLLEAECRRILDATLATRHQEEKRRTGGGPLGAARKANIAEHAAAVRSALFDDYTLPGGMKLGDAMRSDLTEAMGVYLANATDATIKHRFIEHILQCLPAGKRVREAITEERAAELRELARRSDA